MKNEIGEKVDFMLEVSDIADRNSCGANDVQFIQSTVHDGKERYLPYSIEFGSNKVTVFINPNVQITSRDIATGQYSLNHEAGYFIYWAANSSGYYLYMRKSNAENRDWQGGHAADNPSGQSAKKYGDVKDGN